MCQRCVAIQTASATGTAVTPSESCVVALVTFRSRLINRRSAVVVHVFVVYIQKTKDRGRKKERDGETETEAKQRNTVEVHYKIPGIDIEDESRVQGIMALMMIVIATAGGALQKTKFTCNAQVVNNM